jgi:tRNA (guanine-N7-)-methyltransferase
MRLRHKKGIEESELAMIAKPDLKNFNWSNFSSIVLEIGIGKGSYIRKLALLNENQLCIGVEKSLTILNQALLLNQNEPLENLILIHDNVNNLDNYLPEHLVNMIILNFSDPWPKAKHHKRQLTHPSLYPFYDRWLHPEGMIFFKTDNEPFFSQAFSDLETHYLVEQLPYVFNPLLHTEYESKKYELGLKIQSLHARKKEL